MACLWFSITALNIVSACQTLSPGLSYRKRDADAWLGTKANRYEQSLQWALYSSYSQKSLTLPIMSLWKDSFSAPLLQVHTQDCSVSFYVSVCFVNPLLLLLPTHLHALFWISVLKKVLHSDFDREQRQAYMFNLPPLLQWILIHFSNLFHLIFQNTD